MPAINIEEKTIITITTDDGQEIQEGDLILIRATSGEDILCIFKALKDGYFCTETFTEGTPVRYRLKSVAAARKVKGIELTGKEEIIHG